LRRPLLDDRYVFGGVKLFPSRDNPAESYRSRLTIALPRMRQKKLLLFSAPDGGENF
jgi:ATP/maltotriose-dependent transcriptional regulator MalT